MKKETPSTVRPVPLHTDGVVLVVDDEDAVRELAQEMLERLGVTVLVAADGRRALEVYREHQEKISCVLLDLTMPEMDGVETFRELRNLRSDVLVVLSSGYNEEEVKERYGELGLAGFLQKPYQLRNLVDMLRRVLEK